MAFFEERGRKAILEREMGMEFWRIDVEILGIGIIVVDVAYWLYFGFE